MYGDREHNGRDDVCGRTVSHGQIDDGRIDVGRSDYYQRQSHYKVRWTEVKSLNKYNNH